MSIGLADARGLLEYEIRRGHSMCRELGKLFPSITCAGCLMGMGWSIQKVAVNIGHLLQRFY